jgi:hypothetical protein
MKMLAFEVDKPGLTAADFAPYLKAEARRVWELQQASLIRELYFRADQHTAVLMLECATLEDAQAALNSLPLVERGLITFELMPLKPYDGFARLFSE